MVTIARVVEKKLEDRPFIQESLARGIINVAALAEEMIPEIEREMGGKVKFSAVNMAIRRLSEKLNKKFENKTKFDRSSNIAIISDLVCFSLYRTPDLQKYLREISELVDLQAGDFLTITQGMNEITLFTNKKYEKKIQDILPQRTIKIVYRNLSSVTIHIPSSSVETPGLFYLATRALAWESINLIDIVSTVTEMTFIVREKDTMRAFDAIKKTIEKHS
ncbi:MAG: hypothetical protein WCK90_03410 [archaeon]